MTKIIAHRGARSIAPENTIVAADIARLIGAELWETDVSVTRDGHLILFHDDHLLRTTDVLKKFPHYNSFQLDKFYLAQIQTLDTGAAFIENDPFGEIASGNISRDSLESFKGEKIPTLEDALNYTKKTRWSINLELKEQSGKLYGFPLPQAVADMIYKIGVDRELIIISSFNHKWLNQINNLLPGVTTQPLFGDTPDHKIDWREVFSKIIYSQAHSKNISSNVVYPFGYDFETYNINSTMITIEEIARLKSMGKKVNLFTVNDKHEMIQYINANVDGIFTDYPQIMTKIVGKGF